jgi:FlaA1/EpsC-like NDP-sugar epimerase
MAPSRSFSRIALNVVLDAALACAAVPVARMLAVPGVNPLLPAWTILWGGVALTMAGMPFRLATQYWRFATLSDLLGVAAASIAGTTFYVIGLIGFAGIAPPSAAYPAVHMLCLAALLVVPRVIYRLSQGDNVDLVPRRTVLLVGSGEAADLLLSALSAERRPPFRPVGLVCLRAAQTGRRIHNVPILGTLDRIDDILARLRHNNALPDQIVLVDADLPGETLSRLMRAADEQGLRVARAARPTVLDHAEADAGRLDLKPVAIEDLLNRPQWKIDRAAIRRLAQGRRVLVTGAGGSIGSELARQLAELEPTELVLLDNGEYALWQIDQELGARPQGPSRRTVIADIRDAGRIAQVMQTYRPELIFHAAALKHVPMVESNPTEGLLSNALGTRNVADAAASVGAQAMVLISTDKAVNPTSVMGAAKRLAEMYCQSRDIEARAKGGMRCVTVRFGNVLGSTGSVVPLFQRQLERGGPLTVTHPDMERYFMTVREAVGLVLQASVIGCDRDITEGGIFVLDMGEPVKIVDMARQMIRLAGLRPDEDVRIEFTGLRPGEKLYEEIFHGREPPVPTDFPGLLMATPRTVDAALVGRAMDEIALHCQRGEAGAALALLGRLVPEFNHNADGQTALGRSFAGQT